MTQSFIFIVSSFSDIISPYIPFDPLLENEEFTAYKPFKHAIVHVKFYECLIHLVFPRSAILILLYIGFRQASLYIHGFFHCYYIRRLSERLYVIHREISTL